MHPYIPAPYTAHDQFPDAWRGAALSCLVDLGEAALAAALGRLHRARRTPGRRIS